MFLRGGGADDDGRRPPPTRSFRATIDTTDRPPTAPHTPVAVRSAHLAGPAVQRPAADAPLTPPAADAPHAPPAAPQPLDETAPWRRLARRLGVVFLDRIETTVEPEHVTPPAGEVFRRADALLLGEGDGSILVTAPREAVRGEVAALLARHPELRRRVAIATPREIRRALVARHSAALVRRAVRAILDRDPKGSAANATPVLALAPILLVAGAWGVAVLDLSRSLLVAWTALFLGIGVLRAHLAEAIVDPPDAPPVATADLPRFAVLVPLFREADVVGDLVAALLRLDYPADRLDLRLVVEGDDAETRIAAEVAVAGTPVEVLVVPPAAPRTKPKALDLALACVDAPFVTVFDAEDRPDPDQLRKAAAAFRVGGADLAVVQAALEIDHADGDRPWLVRQFEIEYAMLFHGLLPWLARHRFFLPLGGTSNHFRRSALMEIGGWDPHNVTEDADVAVRLMRCGWRADVIAASTLEEAPLDLVRWRAQRVRWLKGWMQTLVRQKYNMKTMGCGVSMHQKIEHRDTVATFSVHLFLY
jgi:glycosyltransferase involved in cell wall biosynthesis